MPVMPRSFAILQAVQLEMQKRPYMVYSQQGSVGSATRPDGKSINLLNEFGLDRCLAKFGQAIDEDWMYNSTLGYSWLRRDYGEALCSVVQTVSMAPLFQIDYVESQAGMLETQVGGQLTAPCVLIQPGAGRTSVTQHANTGSEAKYANCPGVVTLCPHLVYDCKGLMTAAIRYGGPVVFINYSSQSSADIPDEPYVVPIGKGQILKEGTDVTIYTHAPCNVEVEKALPLLEKEGIKAEYFDPRTLKPFDEETLVKSLKKTGRLFCVEFGYYSQGFSSHVMALAAMGVPGIKMWKIAYPDISPPFSTEMNRWNIPDAAKIVDAVKKFMKL